MEVVNSRLLFIDSESVRGNGKEFEVFLDTTKVRTYKDNQLLGISLQSFFRIQELSPRQPDER